MEDAFFYIRESVERSHFAGCIADVRDPMESFLIPYMECCAALAEYGEDEEKWLGCPRCLLFCLDGWGMEGKEIDRRVCLFEQFWIETDNEMRKELEAKAENSPKLDAEKDSSTIFQTTIHVPLFTPLYRV